MMRETDFDDPEGAGEAETAEPEESQTAGQEDEPESESLPDDEYIPRRFVSTPEGIAQPVGPAGTTGVAGTPKRGRGRPRKPVQAGAAPAQTMGKGRVGRPPGGSGMNGMPGGTSRHFPKPVVYHFKDDNAGEARKAPAFFGYMKRASEDPELAARMILYVYRVWPVMRPDSTQQDKTTEPFAYADIEHRYGMGDYHFKLNDVELRKTVAMCTARGFRSEEYPSIVDYTKVDLTDPLNQSWIERAKAKGVKFPGMVETAEQERDMAELKTMERMSDTVDRLTNKVISMAEKKGEERAAPVSVDQEAMTRGLSIVEQAATMGNSMLQTAINRVTEQTAKQVDPMEMLSRTMAMTKDIMQTANQRETTVMAGGGDSQANSVIVEMMKTQLEMQRGFHDTLFQMQQSQINDLKAKLESNAQNTQMATMDHTPKTIIQQIEEMKAVKDSMREVLGVSDDGDSKPPWIQENLPLIIQGLSVLGAVIANGLHNFAVIKTGQGTPAPPPGPDAVLTEEQKAELRERGIPVAGPPQSQNGGQPGGARPTMEGSDMLTQYHQFLAMIKIPLLKSFQEGESGDEFAEKLMLLGDNGHFGEGLQGRQVYDMTISNGKATIMSLIKTYPPIWGVVRTTPQKWEKFMEDFFNAEQLLKTKWEEEEQGDQEQEPAQP